MTEFLNKFQFYKNLAESQIKLAADNLSGEETLVFSMRYSLLAGGKRVRPALMLACADAIKLDLSAVYPFAVALEFIHTYSLIHDDLPAMDNDDYRRGKLTNHKVYGEATAILAGDALLNRAYEILLNAANTQNELAAARLIANYAGLNGMIGGQSLDVLDNKPFDEKTLNFIHSNKTAKLIRAAVETPAKLAGVDAEPFKKYGESVGLLFQITDDILDETSDLQTLGKSVKKDFAENKLTFVSVFGIDGAKLRAEAARLEAVRQAKVIGSEFLEDFANYLSVREK